MAATIHLSQQHSCSLLPLTTLPEDVLDLDVEEVSKRRLEMLDPVTADGGMPARVEHAGPDAIRLQYVLDAPLRDRAAPPVIHPSGGRIGGELLLRPRRRDHALVFRRQKQLDEHGEALAADARLVELLGQLHRGRAYALRPIAAGEIGDRK